MNYGKEYVCPTCKATSHDCCGSISATISTLDGALRALLSSIKPEFLWEPSIPKELRDALSASVIDAGLALDSQSAKGVATNGD